jgi:hypothetical protein
MAVQEKSLRDGFMKERVEVSMADGVNELMKFIVSQNEKLEKLDRVLESLTRTTPTRKKNVVVELPYMDLAKALHLIEKNRDENRRITWSQASDAKALIFAYLRKAEADGINIERTMEMQEIPVYRRVFQYVVYNLGPWKDIIKEYRETSNKMVTI